MKIKFFIGALALAVSFGLVACSDDKSDNPIAEPKTPNNEVAPGCNFTKEDNVWKYSAPMYNFIEIFTWIDDTSVKYEEYMNSYHMAEKDTIYTNTTRDEMFEDIMTDCMNFQGEDW